MNFVYTFLLVFLTNITYTYYLKAVQKNLLSHASSWAAVVTAISCLAVICYVTNPWLVVPATLGSYVGTYIGLKYFKDKDGV